MLNHLNDILVMYQKNKKVLTSLEKLLKDGRGYLIEKEIKELASIKVRLLKEIATLESVIHENHMMGSMI